MAPSHPLSSPLQQPPNPTASRKLFPNPPPSPLPSPSPSRPTRAQIIAKIKATVPRHETETHHVLRDSRNKHRNRVRARRQRNMLRKSQAGNSHNRGQLDVDEFTFVNYSDSFGRVVPESVFASPAALSSTSHTQHHTITSGTTTAHPFTHPFHLLLLLPIPIIAFVLVLTRRALRPRLSPTPTQPADLENGAAAVVADEPLADDSVPFDYPEGSWGAYDNAPSYRDEIDPGDEKRRIREHSISSTWLDWTRTRCDQWSRWVAGDTPPRGRALRRIDHVGLGAAVPEWRGDMC